MRSHRVKVTIFCNVCGERYTLRGKKSQDGKITTGFKRCICNNDNDFRIIEQSD